MGAVATLAANDMLHVRINKTIKKEATKTLEEMGLSASDAVRIFFIRIAKEHAIPFDVRVPNATTIKALKDAEAGKTVARHKTVDDFFDAYK